MAIKAPNQPQAQPVPETSSQTGVHAAEAMSKFGQALDDAKAGVGELGKEAQDRANAYREQLDERSKAWRDEAYVYGDKAKSKANDLADQGKAKASEALTGLSGLIAETAPVIDEKIGAKYGNYARTMADHVQQTASSLEAKSVDELGEDAKAFVRKSPGVALGMAAVAGFMISRLFRGQK